MKTVVSKAIKRAKDEAMKKTSKGRKVTTDDEELIKLLESSKAKIKVIGVGGGGCNIIQRMTEVGILGADTVALGEAADIIRVKKKKIRPKLDMGFVGEITRR